VILIAVVRRTKYSNNRWKRLISAPPMHFVTVDLNLVSPDN
jgi:hypothetical protein